ncbi:beta-ketoacyl synthase chain length factor [Silvimonas amylolytica]|uniref:3-oxoacyl-ACP synthase n=1 Tax=Silvimonas amylolytica TaxID=449663 RepID=A0ABQ2PMA7_9NEIS|nr:beta-ketoacyl synthase chain length factor [Silvimonas amylolytica]GGP26728.1 3-oxoacyl-ACP synthase [Silvimonas amylolytica]
MVYDRGAILGMDGSVVNALHFGLESWAAWAPDLTSAQDWQDWAAQGAPARSLDGAEPGVAGMPPMLRRRAQRLGRMALEVLYQSEADHAASIVFASRFGEIQQSTGLLRELARSHAVSPQAFSMSVHNAVAGLYTIARKDAARVMALAAGTQTAQAGLFEAAMQVADGAPRVRLVFCDEPLPALYRPFAEPETPPFAIMLTLVPGDDYVLSWQEAEAARDANAQDVLRFVLSDASRVSLTTSGWVMARCA